MHSCARLNRLNYTSIISLCVVLPKPVKEHAEFNIMQLNIQCKTSVYISVLIKLEIDVYNYISINHSSNQSEEFNSQ